MPYGTLKADTLTYYTATGDVNLAISGIAISGSPLISGVSGVFTTSVSGATVTGDAGQFTTITGGTAQFTNITGVSGTFTSRISGATVTGTSGQFTTITATTGVFTTSISGATISGDVGLFTTISGSQGVFNSGLSVPSGTASSPSISFNGDPNTGLYSTDADAVAISTGGSGRLFVDSSGNIGLGTNSTATWRMHAANSNQYVANFYQTGGSSHGNKDAVIGASDGTYYNNLGYWAHEHRWNINGGGTEGMRLTSAGHLGIGTSSPAERLTVSGGNIRIEGSADLEFITFVNTSTGGRQWTLANAGAGNVHSAPAGTLYLRDSTASATRIAIDSSGRVGIGTSSPSAPLTIGSIGYSSTDRASALRLFDVGGTNGNNYGFGMDDGTGGFYRTAGNGGFHAWLTANTERLRIDQQGRVGIGTTSPNSQFVVSNGGAAGLEVNPTGVASAPALISYNRSGSAYTQLTHLALQHVFQNSGNEVARIDSSGRLLVGTSSSFAVSRLVGTGLFSGEATQQIQGAGAFAGLSLITNRSVDGTGSFITLGKSRGSTPGSINLVSNGDDLGGIYFVGADGVDLQSMGAAIQAQVDGTPGADDMPGRLVFSTTADGASSPTERVRISQNGVVTVKNGAVAEIGTLTDGATVTPDFAANCNFTLTISGNRTLANPTNITAGQTGSIFIIQGTGSNALSWGSYWDFAGGTAPTLSTASGAVDRVDYVVRTSTSIHTVFTANYS